MPVKESWNPSVNVQNLSVDRDDLKPINFIHLQPENIISVVSIPKSDEMTSKRILHSQTWDNTEVDLTVLEDLQSSIPQPTTIIEVDNTYNRSGFLITSPSQELLNYPRIESTMDGITFTRSTGETPPDSPVGQAPDIIQQQQPYSWCVPVTLDSPPPSTACSSGRSSPARSFFFPRLDASDQSNEIPTAAEILEAILPREGHGPKEEHRDDACFLVTDANQILAYPQIPFARSIGNQEFKTSEVISSSQSVHPSVSSTHRRRRAPRPKNEQNYCVSKSVDTDSRRRDRKKVQNKEAATRYRIKKRLEAQCLQTEENVLVEKNNELREKMKKMENELSYLKSLTKEVLRMKGIIP